MLEQKALTTTERPTTTETPELDERIERIVLLAQCLEPLLGALKSVAHAELVKGPGVSGTAWRDLHDLCALALGEAIALKPQETRGRQPMMVPRQRVVPPARNGATPVWPGQGVDSVPSTPPAAAPLGDVGDVRKRDDVAAELARIAARLGGK